MCLDCFHIMSRCSVSLMRMASARNNGWMDVAKENEIVLFETEDEKVRLTVPIQEDTVWLTQAQMTELFDTSKQNVSLHINNCFKEGELDNCI